MPQVNAVMCVYLTPLQWNDTSVATANYLIHITINNTSFNT